MSSGPRPRSGEYSVAVQLGYQSAAARDADGHARLVSELVSLLAAMRPVNLYTHNLLDKHVTHVAVGTATVLAVRALALEQRPMRMVGIEAWRDLDWLGDDEKLRFDVSRFWVWPTSWPAASRRSSTGRPTTSPRGAAAWPTPRSSSPERPTTPTR